MILNGIPNLHTDFTLILISICFILANAKRIYTVHYTHCGSNFVGGILAVPGIAFSSSSRIFGIGFGPNFGSLTTAYVQEIILQRLIRCSPKFSC